MFCIPNLEKIQKKRVLAAFRHAEKSIPFYREYLKKSNTPIQNIRRFEDFKACVPILNKEKLFTPSANITNNLLGDELKDCRLIFPSSGFSGKFSFGITTKKDLKKQRKAIDRALDYFFDVSSKKTLLINSLSMGINVLSSKVTTINTGLRSDIVLSVIKTFSKEFEQFILVGENLFIKNLLELGKDTGLSWQDYKIHIIFGGESFPESFRSYIENLTNSTSKNTFVGSSLGFAEIGLNVLWETPSTIQIRKKASVDKSLRKALLQIDTELCPTLFQYNPMSIYVEELEGRFLFTNLDPEVRLPVIRYATGDEGSIIPFERLKKVLKQFGMAEHLPKYRLPLVAVKGRDQYIAQGNNRIYPDTIKNTIYSSPELPTLTTGSFKLSESGNNIVIEIQLKKGVTLTSGIEEKFKAALATIPNISSNLKLYPYNEFPYGMELDFERKFKYI